MQTWTRSRSLFTLPTNKNLQYLKIQTAKNKTITPQRRLESYYYFPIRIPPTRRRSEVKHPSLRNPFCSQIFIIYPLTKSGRPSFYLTSFFIRSIDVCSELLCHFVGIGVARSVSLEKYWYIWNVLVIIN